MLFRLNFSILKGKVKQFNVQFKIWNIKLKIEVSRKNMKFKLRCDAGWRVKCSIQNDLKM